MNGRRRGSNGEVFSTSLFAMNDSIKGPSKQRVRYQSRMAEELKLFRNWTSPYALRVDWALKLKGIEFENVYEDLDNKSPSLLQYNPVHKKVPVLLHNEKPICESLVILEYIDDTWKEAPLLPKDPYEKAMSHFWAKFSDEKVFPSIRQFFIFEVADQEEAKGTALENLRIVEEQLIGKTFFSGEKIGYLDLTFGWVAKYISILEEATGLKLFEEDKFPLISAWKQNFSEAPVIKDSWPDKQKLITKFKFMRERHQAATAAK